TLSATDVDSGSLTFSIVTGPAHGSLGSMGAPSRSPVAGLTTCTASVTYSPAADYNGSDSFTFKANDGTLDSNTATVSITVTAVNDAPVASSQSVTTNEDTPKSVTLSATDVDSGSLTFSIVTGPAHGSLGSMGAPSCSTVAGLTTCTASVTYSPAADYNGSDSFNFKANDGSLDSNTATVSITVTAVNDAPVLANGSVLNYTENDAATPINTVITVSDVDNNTQASATVSSTGNFASGEDTLAFSNDGSTMGNISGAYNASTGVLTLTSFGATATIAEWRPALRAVTSSNSSDDPSTASRTVSFV